MPELYRNLQLPNTVGIIIWHLFCLTVISFICERIWRSFRKDPRLVEFAKQLPGPNTWPLIGNGLDFLNNMDGRMEMFKHYEAKYGSTYRLWFGQHLVVGVADVKDLEVVFSSSKLLDKPAFMDPAREFWGDNLFTSRSPLWKKSRKELQPLFTKNILMEKVPIIDSIIQKYMRKIEDRANGPEFDIGKIFPMMAFDTLLEVIFNSSSVEYTEKEYTYLDELMHEADCIFFEKMFKPWLKNSILDYFMYKTFRSHFKRHKAKFCQKVMNNQKNGIASGFHDTGESGMKPTFIQLLYKIRDDLGIGDEYISAETLNTIAAGTLTTSTTLSFCILMLAMHPDVQDKLRGELSAHFDGTDRAADVADLDCLPYLDQVLKETERLFTVVPAFFRDVEEDTRIGSYVFPAGTAILVPVSAIHSNSEYYKNPEKFDPDEHFNEDSVRTRPRLAFIPFSAGARNCIGKVLAELELKLSLVALMRLFVFSTNTKMEDIDLLPGVSATNRNGYWVSVRRRAEKFN